MGKATEFGSTEFWTRVNALNSPWFIDDMTRLLGEIGDKLDVVMVPKIEGAWDIHFVDQYSALLEARYGLKRPILVHAILETAQGVNNVEAIAAASPRMQGMSLGPADLAASRGMKMTRVGGGHPDYRVLADATENTTSAPAPSRIRGITRSPAWSTPALRMASSPSMDRSAIFPIPRPAKHSFATPSCLAVRALGLCILVRSRSQSGCSLRIRPTCASRARFWRRCRTIGAAMIEGKMQDDATWKQARVIVDLARQVAAKDADYAALYQF